MPSALFLSILAAMSIGWASALPMTHIQPDDTDNVIEEDKVDPETRNYFDRVTEIMEKARGQPSSETGARVAEYNSSTDPRNPEELGSYYEGDILYPENESDGRNGLMATSSKWPGGVIPVKLDVGFKFDVIGKVLSAIAQYYLNVPCIKFVPYINQEDYVYITSLETGCWSSVGRIGGAQQLNLQSPGCTSTMGTILHELMHAAGFAHEHSRHDRDDHVVIKTENIQTGRTSNFAKAKDGTTTSYGVPYNYQSVMHYSSTAFSKNGQPTIVGKTPPSAFGHCQCLSSLAHSLSYCLQGIPIPALQSQATATDDGKLPKYPRTYVVNCSAVQPDASVSMGQRAGFAPSDITKLRAMYGCPA